MRTRLTYDIIRAAAVDAANKRMWEGGRKTWNEDDWNAGAREFDRLIRTYPVEEEN